MGRWIFLHTLAFLLSIIPSIICVNCPPGKFDGVYGCEPCPKGTYKVNEGPGPCTRCSGELITNNTGSASSELCYQPCPGGQYIDETGQCQPCPENTYRNELMDTCLICGDGLVTKRKGAMDVSECVPCKRGTYRHWVLCTRCSWDHEKTCCKRRAEEQFVSEKSCNQECTNHSSDCMLNDFCQPCPLNTYKEEGEIDCKPCPNGTTTDVCGAYTVSECKENVESGQDDIGLSRSRTVVMVMSLISIRLLLSELPRVCT